jgi:hypothetical protein
LWRINCYLRGDKIDGNNKHLLSGFSTVDSKFLSIMCQARMVSAGDDGVYTGSGLRGVIPYVQCVAAVFLSQVCS